MAASAEIQAAVLHRLSRDSDATRRGIGLPIGKSALPAIVDAVHDALRAEAIAIAGTLPAALNKRQKFTMVGVIAELMVAEQREV